eukprot:2308001-Rhodomonas_salina.2
MCIRDRCWVDARGAGCEGRWRAAPAAPTLCAVSALRRCASGHGRACCALSHSVCAQASTVREKGERKGRDTGLRDREEKEGEGGGGGREKGGPPRFCRPAPLFMKPRGP